MLEFNHGSINQIIKDLDKSIELHRLIPVLYPECTCNASAIETEKCFKCKSSEVIDDLDCLKSRLNPLNKNTIHHLQFIDLEAFCYSLGKTNVESIEIQPEWNNGKSEGNDQDPITGFTIYATTSRYAMDGNGFHVGYEIITYRWKAYNKTELGIAGLPRLLSNWVVNPNEFEIESRELPAEDIPEHDPECEFKDDPDSFDDCDCAEFFEGYWHPDDDFFYQEIQSILDSCNWIEAEFNLDTREWTLGFTSFNVEEYQTKSDYASSCDQDNGMPSFGNYAY